MAKKELNSVPAIHAVTNDAVLEMPDFVSRARDVMEALGARGAVHVRAQEIPGVRLFRLAEKLAIAQQATESWLVINDRIDIALAAGARAIQLTSHSLSLNDARAVAGTMPLGVSVHAVAEAIAAAKSGASWVVAGSVYPTATHQGEPARGEELVSAIAWKISTPVIAIGGIVPANVPALRRVGAHGVAVIRGIWDSNDAGAAASDYLSSYEADGDT